MRFRPWLALAGLVAVLLLTALPAAAQDKGFDQVKILTDMSNKLPDPPHRSTQWLDFGVSLPVGAFDDRSWDPGFMLRWNQEVWDDGAISILSSVGLAFNDDSRYNEAQENAAYDYGFYDSLQAPISVVKRSHVGLPMACELQIEPMREANWSPVLSAGPAIQWTYESQTRSMYYAISEAEFQRVAVPILTYSPPAPALIADRRITKSYFHLGYQARAGLRAKVGSADNPINMRLTASLNTWFEHDRPVSMVGAMISFGH